MMGILPAHPFLVSFGPRVDCVAQGFFLKGSMGNFTKPKKIGKTGCWFNSSSVLGTAMAKTLLFGIIVLIVAYPFEVVTRTSP